MIPDYCKSIIELLNSNGYEAYVVGGAVRDILSGITPHDYDLATSATPNEMKEVFEKNNIRTIIEQGFKHGTVTVLVDGNLLEITSYRSEGEYSDSRRPDEVSFTRSIEEDVKRRDFTINSMYIDASLNVVDITGGQIDLKNKVIRAVGDPFVRFKEDALRILRALRFASTYGFSIEENTALAMKELRGNLLNISSERIHSELTGIITHKYAANVIREHHEIFEVIIPELKATIGFDQRSKYHNLDVFEHTLKVLDGIPMNENGVRDEALSYAAFFHDIGKPVVFVVDENGRGHMKRHQEAGEIIARSFCLKMKFSNKLTNDICTLILLHDTFPKCERVPVKRFLAKHSLELSERLYILQRADILAHSEIGIKRIDVLNSIIDIKNELVSENACLSLKDLAINGDDLKNLGISDGRLIGKVLKELFDLVLNDELENEYSNCVIFVQNSYL